MPAHTSMARIEQALVKAGATDISKKYDNGICRSITFRMLVNNNPLFFQLPAKVDSCFTILWKEVKRPNLLMSIHYIRCEKKEDENINEKEYSKKLAHAISVVKAKAPFFVNKDPEFFGCLGILISASQQHIKPVIQSDN